MLKYLRSPVVKDILRLQILYSTKYQKKKIYPNNSIDKIKKNKKKDNFNKDLSPGKYYWRVVGSLKDNEKTSPSQILSFDVSEGKKIKLIYPANGIFVNPRGTNKSIKFNWERADIYGNYNIRSIHFYSIAFTNLSSMFEA